MKGLIFRYYSIYVFLLALFAVICYFMPVYEFEPQAKTIISTICIIFLLSIPLSMKLFSMKTKGNKKLKTKEEKQTNYMLWAKIQMYMVALPGFFAAAGYGLLRDRSTIFCYLIAFVALIMCKPSKEKMEECSQDIEEI